MRKRRVRHGIKEKRTTMPHGGVCHRTSNPHKSENVMTRKKKMVREESVMENDWRNEW